MLISEAKIILQLIPRTRAQLITFSGNFPTDNSGLKCILNLILARISSY